MSRKGRERRRAAAQQAAPPSPTPDEIRNWPVFWREAADRRPAPEEGFGDSETPSVRYSPDQRSWSWGGGMSAQFRASLDDDVIEWEEEWPGETSADQPIVEFLAFGAPDDMAPPIVVRDLRESIHFRDRDRWPKLLAEAEALRRSQAERSASTPAQTYRRTDKAVWEWGDEADGYTAILSYKSISWNWHGPKDFGNSIEQPVADFVAFGPDEKTAPEGLAWEMFLAIRERDYRRWPEWLAQARALTGDVEIKRHPDYVSHGGSSWEWRDEYNRYSASVKGDQIQWCWEGPKDLGGATEQSFAAFLSRGPIEPKAPAGVIKEINDAIAARNGGIGGGGGPPPKRGRNGAASDGPSNRSVQPDGENQVPPLGPLLVQGLAVVGSSAAIAALLALSAPTFAKYLSLILPVLLGFAAMFRWGSVALVVSGLFAMAGGLASQVAYERYSELASGTAVTLDSIAHAPNHPEATRFIVADVQAARALTGHARRSVMLRSGAGPSPQVVSALAMPLVPSGWMRDREVPAWLTCTNTSGFDCLRPSESDLKRTIRIREAELDFHREAIADAQRRHGVRSAGGAPVLEISSDPVGAPSFYLGLTLTTPLLAFAVWACGVVGWRIWRFQREGQSAPA